MLFTSMYRAGHPENCIIWLYAHNMWDQSIPKQKYSNLQKKVLTCGVMILLMNQLVRPQHYLLTVCKNIIFSRWVPRWWENNIHAYFHNSTASKRASSTPRSTWESMLSWPSPEASIPAYRTTSNYWVALGEITRVRRGTWVLDDSLVVQTKIWKTGWVPVVNT